MRLWHAWASAVLTLAPSKSVLNIPSKYVTTLIRSPAAQLQQNKYLYFSRYLLEDLAPNKYYVRFFTFESINIQGRGDHAVETEFTEIDGFGVPAGAEVLLLTQEEEGDLDNKKIGLDETDKNKYIWDKHKYLPPKEHELRIKNKKTSVSCKMDPDGGPNCYYTIIPD